MRQENPASEGSESSWVGLEARMQRTEQAELRFRGSELVTAYMKRPLSGLSVGVELGSQGSVAVCTRQLLPPYSWNS